MCAGGVAREAEKGIITLRSVFTGIASVRWWINRASRRRKRKPRQSEGKRDEKKTAL
jgi:hypothetical protein